MTYDAVGLISFFVGLVLALTLHEFAHAYVSDLLGDSTAEREGRLTINPLAHIDPVFTLALPLLSYLATGIAIGAAKPVPFNPWAVRWGRFGAALVAFAGPATNLLIALVLGLWLRFVPHTVLTTEVLGTIILTNIGLFVFNMIPFPPLDGSRLLYAVAPEPVRELMDRIERAGLLAILVLLFVLYPFISPFITRAVRAIFTLLVPAGPLP